MSEITNDIRLNPVWHRMLCCSTHMATLGVKGLSGCLVYTGCDEGWYGAGCQQPCACQHAGRCDVITGACSCAAGWVGSTCQQACPTGRYGLNCSRHCACLNDAACDHVTGRCHCPPGFTGSLCESRKSLQGWNCRCLLYTSDAADE